MKIYHANVINAGGGWDPLKDILFPYQIGLLNAFPYCPNQLYIPPYCNSFFLDSGAFSAFRSGTTIDLDTYIQFIRKNETRIDCYANLDVIGDPIKTKENQKRMEKRGLHPIPCYHHGEKSYFLHYYLEKYDHIALGGMVPLATNKDILNRWLCWCWDEIYSRSPQTKVHGFGMSSISMMKKFPWFSIDSGSAHLSALTGSIFTPWGTLRPSSITPGRKRDRMEQWASRLMERPISLQDLSDEILCFVLSVRYLETDVDWEVNSFDPNKHLVPPLF